MLTTYFVPGIILNGLCKIPLSRFPQSQSSGRYYECLHFTVGETIPMRNSQSNGSSEYCIRDSKRYFGDYFKLWPKITKLQERTITLPGPNFFTYIGITSTLSIKSEQEIKEAYGGGYQETTQMGLSKNKDNSLLQVTKVHLGIGPHFNLARFRFSVNVIGSQLLANFIPVCFFISVWVFY